MGERCQWGEGSCGEPRESSRHSTYDHEHDPKYSCHPFADPTPAPTAPLTAEHLATARAQAESALAGCAFCGSPHTGQAMHKPVPYVLEVPASEMLELLDHIDAIARHREQADAEVARLKAAIPEDPWVWLSRRQPGHARCYACDASWSLSQGHEPDCRWVSARSVK